MFHITMLRKSKTEQTFLIYIYIYIPFYYVLLRTKILCIYHEIDRDKHIRGWT